MNNTTRHSNRDIRGRFLGCSQRDYFLVPVTAAEMARDAAIAHSGWTPRSASKPEPVAEQPLSGVGYSAETEIDFMDCL